jgi:hypothetical protein
MSQEEIAQVNEQGSEQEMAQPDTEANNEQETAPENGGVNVKKLLDEKADLLKESMSRKAKITTIEKQNKELKAKLDKIEAAKRNDARAKETNIEKIEASFKEEYMPQIEARDQTIARITGKLRDTIVTSVVQASAIQQGAHRQSLNDFVQIVQQGISIDPETLEPFIVDADGTPKVGRAGRDMTIEEYVKTMLEAKPYFKVATQTQGSGSGNASTTQGGYTRDQVKNMNNEEWGANRDAIFQSIGNMSK